MTDLTRAESIELCFAAYLALIALFAVVYHRIYLSYPDSFLFAEELVPAQRQALVRRTEERITVLKALSEALPRIARMVDAGRSIETLATEGFSAKTQDGMIFRVFTMLELDSFRGNRDIPFVEVQSEAGIPLHSEPIAPMGRGFPRTRSRALRAQCESVSTRMKRESELLTNLNTGHAQIWSFWDFVYFSGIAQTTVGFGDVLPNSTRIRLCVLTQILLGYAILVVALNVVLNS